MKCNVLNTLQLFRWPLSVNSQVRLIHVSIPCSAGSDWRKTRGMPANPNAYGPLTDLPDYSFVDGRRVPAGAGKLRRVKEQEQITQKIIKLSGEIDFAIGRHQERRVKEEQRRQSILDRKLKPKGEHLVTNVSIMKD